MRMHIRITIKIANELGLIMQYIVCMPYQPQSHQPQPHQPQSHQPQSHQPQPHRISRSSFHCHYIMTHRLLISHLTP